MLTYADVRMLTYVCYRAYADVRMLTYADSVRLKHGVVVPKRRKSVAKFQFTTDSRPSAYFIT
jgi:hypothetical protein